MTDRERPTPRSRPRPAPDDDEDPIISSVRTPPPPARPPAPPAVVPRPAGRAVPTVQLNTRVAPEIDAVVNAVAAERGWTKREVIEQAIKAAYPDELSSVLARS